MKENIEQVNNEDVEKSAEADKQTPEDDWQYLKKTINCRDGHEFK